LTLSNVISGPGGLTKYLGGEVILQGANTYLGSTFVQAGVLHIQNNTALGGIKPGTSVHSGTVVKSGAALWLTAVAGPSLTIVEPLTLEGTGVNNTGAVRNLGGTNTMKGSILLTGSTTVGVEAGSGDPPGNSELTLSGDIDELGGSFGLTKTGPNRLILRGTNLF
jgi:autotransporter-associated beta strand protein